MTTKVSKEDELIDWLLHEPSYTPANMREKIQALIDQRCTEARIDELEIFYIAQFPNSGQPDLLSQQFRKYIDRRTKQLQGDHPNE